MTSREYHRVLLVFLDGVGLAPEAETNPLAVCSSPALDQLLGGSLTTERVQSGPERLLRDLDATMGVAGLPQSATGQTALFTGRNAAAMVGRHVTGFPGETLRRLIARDSIFRRAREAGHRATFANAYSRDYLTALAAGRARASVTTCAVAAAGLDYRTVADLEVGRAATWDVERDLFGRPLGRGRSWASRREPVDARLVGGHLAGLAAENRLTVYESFLPDLAGHGRVELPAAEVVRRIDRLIDGILLGRTPETTLVVTSDHGNFEESGVSTHTRAPVPLLAVGPAAADLAEVEAIEELAPRLLEVLDPASF